MIDGIGYSYRRVSPTDHRLRDPQGARSTLADRHRFRLAVPGPDRDLPGPRQRICQRCNDMVSAVCGATELDSRCSRPAASVLADLTGLHITTALRWTTLAKRDWADFVAHERHQRTPGTGINGERRIGKKIMKFQYYDLGQLKRGAVVVVQLSGNAPTCASWTGATTPTNKNGRSIATRRPRDRSPVRLAVPPTDTGTYRRHDRALGSVRTGVSVEPPPLPRLGSSTMTAP